MMARSTSSRVRRRVRRAPRTPRSGRLDHHVLQLGVGLDRVHRHVLATPDCLNPPCGISDTSGPWSFTQTVPNCSALAHPHRPADVARPHRSRPARSRRRWPRRCASRLVGEPLHGDDGPEHLALDDLGVLVDAGDDASARRRSPAPVGARAAGHDRGAAAPRLDRRSRRPARRCSAEITGPSSVAASAGSPTTSALGRVGQTGARSRRARRGRRAPGVAAVQSWPAL